MFEYCSVAHYHLDDIGNYHSRYLYSYIRYYRNIQHTRTHFRSNNRNIVHDVHNVSS